VPVTRSLTWPSRESTLETNSNCSVHELMLRRTFFRRMLSGLGATVAAPATLANKSRVVIQESPIAGFQFHDGETVWNSLAVGDELRLAREAENPHDGNAVAIYRGTAKLGYVPRGENTAVAQLMDRGECLSATIASVTADQDPWKRTRITIAFA